MKYYSVVHSEHYNYCHELRSNNFKHIRKFSNRYARVGCLNVTHTIIVDIYKFDDLISSIAVHYNRSRHKFSYFKYSYA